MASADLKINVMMSLRPSAGERIAGQAFGLAMAGGFGYLAGQVLGTTSAVVIGAVAWFCASWSSAALFWFLFRLARRLDAKKDPAPTWVERIGSRRAAP